MCQIVFLRFKFMILLSPKSPFSVLFFFALELKLSKAKKILAFDKPVLFVKPNHVLLLTTKKKKRENELVKSEPAIFFFFLVPQN